ncbi:putative holin [Ottowia sp.]|uniref:putative holin n=1 Tax=Ottowia sp. TaxID=1898956 RepID=UPI003A8869D8
MPNPLKTPLRLWRMTDWLLATLALLVVVWLMAPHQLPVSVYKLSLVTMAAVVGYWIDRSLFPYARPDIFLAGEANAEPLPDAAAAECGTDDVCVLAVADGSGPQLMAMAMLRRAIIVAAAMLAMGLGA